MMRDILWQRWSGRRETAVRQPSRNKISPSRRVLVIKNLKRPSVYSLPPQARRRCSVSDLLPLQVQVQVLHSGFRGNDGKHPMSRLRKSTKTRSLTSIRTWYQNAPPTAKISIRTAAYIFLLGTLLLLHPPIISIFTDESVPVGWVRVGGVMAALFGSYYLGAALDDAENRFPLRFYQSTIIGRYSLSAIFLVLVITKQSANTLLFLSLANMVSAYALQRRLSKR